MFIGTYYASYLCVCDIPYLDVSPPTPKYYVYANIPKLNILKSEILLIPSISDKGCSNCMVNKFLICQSPNIM
jgi:hypothetical protein